MITTLKGLMLFLVMIGSVFAAENVPMIFGLPFSMPVFRTLPPLEHCYEQHSERAEARACLKALKDEADASLRQTVSRVKAHMSELDKHAGRTQALRAFDQSQRQFAAWREANCRFYGAQTVMKANEADVMTDCYIRMTNARRGELIAFGGEVSAATANEPVTSASPSAPSDAPMAEPSGMLNTDWRLREIAEGTRRVPIPEGALVTLRLGEGGRVSGNAAVNRYFSGYRLGPEDAIAWSGSFATTRMQGPPELMAFEQAYLGALARVSLTRQEQKTLWLFDRTRELTLTFVRP